MLINPPKIGIFYEKNKNELKMGGKSLSGVEYTSGNGALRATLHEA